MQSANCGGNNLCRYLNMELFVYNGFAELSSIDFNCLRIITFIKVHQIPVKITTSGNPARSPNGFLPYLQVDNVNRIGGYDEIVAHFKSLGHGVVPESEDFLATAYLQYLSKNLYPCFQYILWGDPVNRDTSRTLYAKRCPFPFNFTHPAKYTAHTDELMQIVGNFSIEDKLDDHNSAELLLNAKSCINMISSKLEKQDWFLGKQIGEVDCTIYAYLAILKHIGVTSNALQAHINECPSLLRVTKDIRAKYLKDHVEVKAETGMVFDRIKDLFINKEDGTLSSTMVKFCAGLAAVTTMILFAVTHGLLEFTFDDDEFAADYATHDDTTDEYDEE